MIVLTRDLGTSRQKVPELVKGPSRRLTSDMYAKFALSFRILVEVSELENRLASFALDGFMSENGFLPTYSNPEKIILDIHSGIMSYPVTIVFVG